MEANTPLIALMGNPNSGKTAIFNLLTGMNHKVSNYPGITVEKRKGTALLLQNTQVEILDMPGTYSLTPESLDEKIETVIKRLSEHPFVQSQPDQARQVAQFRVRLLDL